MLKEKIAESRGKNPDLTDYTHFLIAVAEILKNSGYEVEAEELNRDWAHLFNKDAQNFHEVAVNFISWIQTYGYPTEVERVMANRLPVFRLEVRLQEAVLKAWEDSIKEAMRSVGIRRNGAKYKDFLNYTAERASTGMLAVITSKIQSQKSFIEQNTIEIERCLAKCMQYVNRLNRLTYLIEAFAKIGEVYGEDKIGLIDKKIEKVMQAVDRLAKSLDYYKNLEIKPEDILTEAVKGYPRLEDLWNNYKEARNGQG